MRISQQLRGQFDIFHSFDYSDSWLDVLAAQFAGLRCVVTKTNMNWGNRRWFLRSLFADRIVCLSYAQRDALYAHHFWSRKTVVIPVGIDLEAFYPVSGISREALRQEFGWKSTEIVLGCVAHLVPVKGHKDLINAFSQLVQKHNTARLVLVGGGSPEYEKELQTLIARLGVTNRVDMLGVRHDVPRLMQGFDGLVLSSRKEGFGTVLVEAMATGLPVIATRSGGPEDIVIPGETGWLVEPGDVSALTSAMLDFMESVEKRQRYGFAGLARAREQFSLKRMVESHQKLYQGFSQQPESLRGKLRRSSL